MNSNTDQIAHSTPFDRFGRSDQPLTFAQLPFEQPAFIDYSLGTSKSLVHTGGGSLIQQLKENILHFDMGAEDRCFHVGPCDDALWNAFVSGLATGATIVLFDGTDPTAIWRIAAEERVTILRINASFLSTSEQQALRPREEFDLSALKTVIATGAPLSPASYQYVYRDVHPDVQLSPITVASLGTGSSTLPVYEGEIQALGLGMKVEVFDDAGQPLTGQRGELVCTQPFPSMPIGLGGEADFSRYPSAWSQGELATLTSRRTLIVHNRSDG
jgi:acetoacetyl-CoA synthetase